MTTLMQASRQWANRPDDERFTSLHALHAHTVEQRERSKAIVVSSRSLEFTPDENDVWGLKLGRRGGAAYEPTHHAFGQLATLAEAPAGYLRTLPAAMVADCLNYGLRFKRDVAEIGVLVRKPNGHAGEIAAATGPNYGRIWNEQITGQLVERFGDGVTGDWRVPGEFGKAVQVTKANTTLYASDRDMFVFLADETNRIEVPNRRDGKAGVMARGFFVWNSEVGAATFGFAQFLFDYVCCNRIVWGAQGYQEIRLRHTAGAPDRYIEQIQPALRALHDASATPVVDTIKAAQAAKVEDLTAFLTSKRFAPSLAQKIAPGFAVEEGRPIETVWDTVTALTAYARELPYQDERVALERQASKLLIL